MNNLSLRRSFVAFHTTLAVVVFLQSVRTIVEASSHHAGNPLGSHLSILASLEALAALLFLVPRTLKAGGIALLCIFFFAAVVHGIEHELALVVYAAGVLFVIVHGSAFSKDLFRTRRLAS